MRSSIRFQDDEAVKACWEGVGNRVRPGYPGLKSLLDRCVKNGCNSERNVLGDEQQGGCVFCECAGFKGS